MELHIVYIDQKQLFLAKAALLYDVEQLRAKIIWAAVSLTFFKKVLHLKYLTSMGCSLLLSFY